MTEQTPDRSLPTGPNLTAENRERIEEWISERLDVSPVNWKETDFAELEQAVSEVQRRVADLQWLHGLLLQARQSHIESQPERIQRAGSIARLNNHGRAVRAAAIRRESGGRVRASLTC